MENNSRALIIYYIVKVLLKFDELYNLTHQIYDYLLIEIRACKSQAEDQNQMGIQ
jgi:hypothetical protein